MVKPIIDDSNVSYIIDQTKPTEYNGKKIMIDGKQYTLYVNNRVRSNGKTYYWLIKKRNIVKDQSQKLNDSLIAKYKNKLMTIDMKIENLTKLKAMINKEIYDLENKVSPVKISVDKHISDEDIIFNKFDRIVENFHNDIQKRTVDNDQLTYEMNRLMAISS